MSCCDVEPSPLPLVLPTPPSLEQLQQSGTLSPAASNLAALLSRLLNSRRTAQPEAAGGEEVSMGARMQHLFSEEPPARQFVLVRTGGRVIVFINESDGTSRAIQLSSLLRPARKHLIQQKIDKFYPSISGQEAAAGLCTVCMDIIEHNESHRMLRCGHRFHTECVDEWLTGRSTGNDCDTNICPNCRREVECVECQEESAAPRAPLIHCSSGRHFPINTRRARPRSAIAATRSFDSALAISGMAAGLRTSRRRFMY